MSKNLEKAKAILLSLTPKDFKEHIKGKIAVMRPATLLWNGRVYNLGTPYMTGEDLTCRRLFFGDKQHGYIFVCEDDSFMGKSNLIGNISNNSLKTFIRKHRDATKSEALDFVIEKCKECFMFKMLGGDEVLSDVIEPDPYAEDKSAKLLKYKSELEKVEREIRELSAVKDKIELKVLKLKKYQSIHKVSLKIKK